jgi:hypothetical protein
VRWTGPFETGAEVALRDVWEGAVWAARPALVVEHAADQITLFIPVGTRWFAPVRDGRRLKIPEPGFELMQRANEDAHVLSFAWPGTFAAALLVFRSDWSPLHWYVNLEEPLRRTAIGFDTLDRQLDVILGFDGAWRWKDEDELTESIRRGTLRPSDELKLRAAAERTVDRIVGREPPFDREWTAWRPDPRWPIPELPDGWQRV